MLANHSLQSHIYVTCLSSLLGMFHLNSIAFRINTYFKYNCNFICTPSTQTNRSQNQLHCVQFTPRTHHTAAAEHNQKTEYRTGGAHHPGETDEQDDAENVLNARQEYANQSACGERCNGWMVRAEMCGHFNWQWGASIPIWADGGGGLASGSVASGIVFL